MRRCAGQKIECEDKLRSILAQLEFTQTIRDYDQKGAYMSQKHIRTQVTLGMRGKIEGRSRSCGEGLSVVRAHALY